MGARHTDRYEVDFISISMPSRKPSAPPSGAATGLSQPHRDRLMNHKLLALYGLKHNPFSPALPVEALHRTAKIEHFCWRIEQGLVREGGFALIGGDPGTGKSAAPRLLAERLSQWLELTVGALVHPSSNLGDFYREMGDLFGPCPMRPPVTSSSSSTSSPLPSKTTTAPRYADMKEMDFLCGGLPAWHQAWLDPDEACALDGKTMKGAVDEDGAQTYIVILVGPDSGRCLAQKKSAP